MPHRKQPSGTVYLVHLARPYHHVHHYIGWTSLAVEQRMAHHRAGQGARLLEVVTNAGIEYHVSQTWPGTRELERKLKNQHNARRHCPLCKKTGH